MKCSFIGDATYALMLYILYATDEMLKNTTFYVGTNCETCNLPDKVIMPLISPYTDKELFHYRLRCLRYRTKLKNSEIYAQDHVSFAPALIDNIPYNVLEDCPHFFSIREERNEIQFKPTLSSFWYNIKVGRIYRRYAGHNPWCKKRIITTMKDKNLFERNCLNHELVSLKDLWNDSSEYKRTFLFKTFSLEQLENIKKDVVIFSQPLVEDASLSKEEVVSIYQPYIEKYGANNILVKLHPRDKFDYKMFFPGIETLCTKAPQQLLDLMGIKFKTAITVCSSAVSSMSNACEIIWLGAEIDDRIVKAYGHINNPMLH